MRNTSLFGQLPFNPQSQEGQALAALEEKAQLLIRQALEKIRDALDLKCTICQERFDGKQRTEYTTPCSHTFCVQCLQKTFEWQQKHTEGMHCPSCRSPLRAI